MCGASHHSLMGPRPGTLPATAVCGHVTLAPQAVVHGFGWSDNTRLENNTRTVEQYTALRTSASDTVTSQWTSRGRRVVIHRVGECTHPSILGLAVLNEVYPSIAGLAVLIAGLALPCLSLYKDEHVHAIYSLNISHPTVTAVQGHIKKGPGQIRKRETGDAE